MFKNKIKKIVFFIYARCKYINRNIRFLGVSYIDLNCKFEGHNSIDENNTLISSSLGLGTYIGKNTYFSYTKIGRFCSIASNVHNVFGNHPIDTFVSTHPAFYSKGFPYTFSKIQKFDDIQFISPDILVEIGNDVWIGDNVTILGNVKVGDGAIIGANSLVKNDIEPYSINVGSPAKIIGYRFDKETIGFLLDFKWWDKGFDWIKKNSEDFQNIEEFRVKNKKV
jgi:acetyltransferase-like isoleucine patch superfamily enzyme